MALTILAVSSIAWLRDQLRDDLGAQRAADGADAHRLELACRKSDWRWFACLMQVAASNNALSKKCPGLSLRNVRRNAVEACTEACA